LKSRRKPVQVGDTFKKADATRWLWQVAEIFQPSGHCLHARLVRKNVAHDVRVFSLVALGDRRLFAPVDDRRSHECTPVRPAGPMAPTKVLPMPGIRIDLISPSPLGVAQREMSLPSKERSQTELG
jgi:hypothetical protein